MVIGLLGEIGGIAKILFSERKLRKLRNSMK
jgi:hypothetical protein